MKRFKNILVVADNASATPAVFERATRIARANDATITLVDVIEEEMKDLSNLFGVLPSGRGKELQQQIVDEHTHRLGALAEEMSREGLPVKTRLLHGIGFIEIIRAVLSDGYDLVLKSALRSSSNGALQGPDLHLLRKCPCPVWILNGPALSQSARIAAAVDPDPSDPVRDDLNRMVMQLATSLAERDGASLDVVNAWRLPEESALRHGRAKVPEAEVDAIVAEAGRQSAWRLQMLTAEFNQFADDMRVVHIKGDAADVLTDHAHDEEIDTLVMGTVARTGVAGFFIGNTAETVLNRVKCSVLTVKPQGFISPVALPDGETA